MKKRLLIICIVVTILLIIPIPTGVVRDGGTKTYTALTYKIVDWNHECGDGAVFDKTKVYFFPKNFTSLDELIKQELEN